MSDPNASAWQKRLASGLDHTEISQEAHDILKDFQHSAKVVGSAGRVLSVSGAAIGTAILPGLGTAVGGIVDGLILGVAGSSLGKMGG